MKNQNSSSDPLKRLGRKKLRNLAKKNKIKNIHLKSPSALRRAIRRAEARKQKGLTPNVKRRAVQQADERRQEELKAYQEHRFRYLYAPSRFAHMGTHEEYLLEKDDDLNLPDFYLENELRVLPVDPWQYYVYWDFEPVLLEKVKQYLAWEESFVLRSYDVTSIAFDGSNAHSSWDAICHPLVREWYINSPVHDRHICVELGVVLEAGFLPLLRSNTIYIPPATVSPVRRDLFGRFIPRQEAPAVVAVPTPLLPQNPPQPVVPASQQIADVFFQPYIPTPILLHPRPQPQRVLDYATMPRYLPEHLVPPVSQTGPVFHSEPGVAMPVVLPSAPAADSVRTPSPASPESLSESQPETFWQHREARWSDVQDRAAAQLAGRESIHQALGLEPGTEIRWFSELPTELSPLIFEQWITDPYDQAMFVSYSIWPWEMTEYLPLGASDWTLRKFLGASLFSWFRPAGSERMLRWRSFPGASEGLRWLRPVGASERAWSGSLQPPTFREGSAWYAWPQRLLNYSGRGIFS